MCQMAMFPVPSSVEMLPPNFISGSPEKGGHSFSTLPSAESQVLLLATKVSVPGARETLRYMVAPGW